jgi:histidinol-phosphate aminotransferase
MLKSLAEFIPAHIRALHPYVPGKPVEEVERELKLIAIKLASNENPLGPSPLAMAAARDYLANVHRYPDGQGYYLKQKLAERFSFPAEQLILGAGTTDIIEMAATAFLQGSEAATSEGSFVMYYVAAQMVGCTLHCVPLKDFTYDLEALAARLTPQTRAVFIANPNNPTGTYRNATEMDRFLARIPPEVIVVLDEAYAEYVDDPNYSHSLEYVRQGRNVLVLRTFSKVYGLAGMRIGYGFGPAEVIEYLNRVRNPFNTSSVAQVAAMAALDDHEHVRRSVENNCREMEWLARNFRELGVSYVPSVTNFVLADLGRDADEVFQLLLREGVIVRSMKTNGFPTGVRITVGRREENLRLIEALKRVALPAHVPAD